MPFCTNCGQEIKEGAKFCTNCGQPVVPYKTGNTERRTVYEGELHKCPNCNALIPSFVGNCPFCGWEMRGNSAAASVQELYQELNNAETASEKSDMIRHFPIPNSKEDVREFMILASTNILGEDDPDIYEAWLAKFEQAYQKALLLFKTEEELAWIQSLYESCQDNISSEKQRKISRLTRDTVVRNIAVGAGILLIIFAIVVDRHHGNGSLIELAAYIILIASAVSLAWRGTAIIDYVVGIASGLLTILLSFLLNNGSMAELCGVIILIIVAVNCFKGLRAPGNNAGTGRKKAKQERDALDESEYEVVKARIPTPVVNGTVKNYAVAEQFFIQAGFTNVKTVPLNDLTFGIRKKVGTIDMITINGKELSVYFRRKFDTDVPILITYHSFRS